MDIHQKIEEIKTTLTTAGEVFLRIKVHPRAPKTELYDLLDDDTIKMRVHAVPERGKANIEIQSYLARFFAVPKTHIVILSGHTDSLKLIKVSL